MTHPDHSWESTFIPGTRVLANKFGIDDPTQLRHVEYRLTAVTERQILTGQLAIDRTYDADHLRSLHTALFADIYEWAGITRTYPLSKAGIAFADPRQIPAYLDAAAHHIATTDWDGLDHGSAAVEVATTYAYLNTAHPYREGNGRSAKLLVRQLLRDHGYDLDLSRITPQQWNNSSALTMPDRGTFEPVPDLLIPVFSRTIIDYTPPPPTDSTIATQAAGPLTPGPSRQPTAASPPPTPARQPTTSHYHRPHGRRGPDRPAGPTR